jgi:photosynthetic reaction center H subunit
MPTGAITGYIDVAQLTLYAFWLFFAGLIFYLRREDKREGYPLENERSGLVTVQGFPFMPSPKVFLLSDGHKVYAPRIEAPTPVPGTVASGLGWLGAPLDPIGNPMIQSIGPASYVERADVPDMMFETPVPKLVPLRIGTEYWLAEEDPDPRGMAVVGADGVVGGTCTDAWIDRADMIVRYLEVAVSVGVPKSVLVPMTLVRISTDRNLVVVQSVMGDQFAEAPVLANPDQITLREEDRVSAYFASGQMYASPDRMGPLV